MSTQAYSGDNKKSEIQATPGGAIERDAVIVAIKKIREEWQMAVDGDAQLGVKFIGN